MAVIGLVLRCDNSLRKNGNKKFTLQATLPKVSNMRFLIHFWYHRGVKFKSIDAVFLGFPWCSLPSGNKTKAMLGELGPALGLCFSLHLWLYLCLFCTCMLCSFFFAR